MIYKKIYVINPAKVGSATFYHSLNKDYECIHSHNLKLLIDILENEKDNLIICGVRNPIERNISYFFQTYKDCFKNDFKTKNNNYSGEYCYNENLIYSSDENEFIKEIINSKYQNTYIEWLREFLEITRIKKFDKVQGYKYYKIGYNTILIYTQEKLKDNLKYFEDYFNVKFENYNINNSILYEKVKKKIKFNEDYINNNVKVNIMNIFYKKKDLDLLINKYI